MKRATQNKQFAEIDHAIKTKVSTSYFEKKKIELTYVLNLGGTIFI